MRDDRQPWQDRALLVLHRAGNRVWVALGIAVAIVVLLSLARVVGFLVIIAIQLAIVGFVVYLAVRLALRHHARTGPRLVVGGKDRPDLRRIDGDSA
jgi:hypothetical protein